MGRSSASPVARLLAHLLLFHSSPSRARLAQRLVLTWKTRTASLIAFIKNPLNCWWLFWHSVESSRLLLPSERDTHHAIGPPNYRWLSSGGCVSDPRTTKVWTPEAFPLSTELLIDPNICIMSVYNDWEFPVTCHRTIGDFLLCVPAASPFVPAACQSDSGCPTRSRDTKGTISLVDDFTECSVNESFVVIFFVDKRTKDRDRY